jgi:uncharacterized protein (DUF2249 family)
MRLKEKFIPAPRIVLLEEKYGDKKLRFCFAEADKKNLNDRVYPCRVLTKAVAAAQKKIESGESIFGTSDHKESPLVDDVSHRLTRFGMDGKSAMAEAAILSTAKGKNLLAIIMSGGSVGVSMRGTGTILENVVQEDYELEGVDVCLNPSFGNRISKENIFECAQFWTPRLSLKGDDKKVLSDLFRQALEAGFTGTKAEYLNIRRKR